MMMMMMIMMIYQSKIGLVTFSNYSLHEKRSSWGTVSTRPRMCNGVLHAIQARIICDAL